MLPFGLCEPSQGMWQPARYYLYVCQVDGAGEEGSALAIRQSKFKIIEVWMDHGGGATRLTLLL